MRLFAVLETVTVYNENNLSYCVIPFRRNPGCNNCFVLKYTVLCSSQTCSNGGTCSAQGTTITCTCPPDYMGPQCDTLDHCFSTPCLNGGTCTNVGSSFICECQPGFSGQFCSININDCASPVCQNGGTCMDLMNSFICLCTPGFTGKDCSVIVSDCLSNPCLNGGTCTDLDVNFICECPSGYTGQNCSINTDDCASSPCHDGSTCVDLENGFACSCTPGFTGPRCSIAGNTKLLLSHPMTVSATVHPETSSDSSDDGISPIEIAVVAVGVALCLGAAALLVVVGVIMGVRKRRKCKVQSPSVSPNSSYGLADLTDSVKPIANLAYGMLGKLPI